MKLICISSIMIQLRKKNSKFFLLVHAYDYGEEYEHTEIKNLGIYTTKKEAEKAKKRYSKLAGFNEFDSDNFLIQGYDINQDMYWNEGFFDATEE